MRIFKITLLISAERWHCEACPIILDQVNYESTNTDVYLSTLHSLNNLASLLMRIWLWFGDFISISSRASFYCRMRDVKTICDLEHTILESCYQGASNFKHVVANWLISSAAFQLSYKASGAILHEFVEVPRTWSRASIDWSLNYCYSLCLLVELWGRPFDFKYVQGCQSLHLSWIHAS